MHQLWWWWNPSWQPWHRIWNSSIAYDYCDMVMWEGKGFFFFSSYELWVDSVHFLPIQTEQCFCTSKSEELLVECSWWQWWLWRHERPGINRQMLYTFLYRTVILFSYCRQISRRSKLTVCYSVFQCFWTFLPSVWHRELRAHWFLLKTQILKKQIPFSAMCVQITWLLA